MSYQISFSLFFYLDFYGHNGNFVNDDNGNQIIERVHIEPSCRDRYPKVTTTLTRRERRHWRIERLIRSS